MTPNTITFTIDNNTTEIMRISEKGVTVNPKFPPDEIAQKVLVALDEHIKFIISNVRKEYDRKPLTEDEIDELLNSDVAENGGSHAFARAIEKAHGIGVDNE